MGLLTTASSTNRVVDQANTYNFDVEPAQQFSTVHAVNEGSSYTIGEKVIITQWRVNAYFAKRYRYVGLSGGAAKTIAEAISAAYIMDMARYALGFYVDASRGISVYKYLPVEGANVPTCCATATATHGDGPMWSVEVDVNATIEAYYDSVPSASSIKSLFSGIANFPEGTTVNGGSGS